MDGIVKFLTGLFEDFSWSKLSFLLVIIISIFSFEAYTAKYKLERISNELQIIETLVELEKKIQTLPKDSPVKTYFKKVMENTQENSINFPLQFGKNFVDWSKLFYLSLPWFLVVMILVLTEQKNKSDAIQNALTIGTPIVFLGYQLPNSEYIWINKYLYPWGTFAFIIGMILLLQRRSKS